MPLTPEEELELAQLEAAEAAERNANKPWPNSLPYRANSGHVHPKAQPILGIEKYYGVNPAMLTPDQLQEFNAENERLKRSAAIDPHRTKARLEKRYKNPEMVYSDPQFVELINTAKAFYGEKATEVPLIEDLKAGRISPEQARKEIMRQATLTGALSPQTVGSWKDFGMTIGKTGAGMGVDLLNKAMTAGHLLNAAVNPKAKSIKQTYEQRKKEEDEFTDKLSTGALSSLMQHVPDSAIGQGIETLIQKSGERIKSLQDKVSPHIGRVALGGMKIINDLAKGLGQAGSLKVVPKGIGKMPDIKGAPSGKDIINIKQWEENPKALGDMITDLTDLGLTLVPASKFVRGRILAPTARGINKLDLPNLFTKDPINKPLISPKIIEKITPKPSILERMGDRKAKPIDPRLEEYYDKSVRRMAGAESLEDLLAAERTARETGDVMPTIEQRNKWKPFAPRQSLGDIYGLGLYKARGFLERADGLAKDMLTEMRKEIPDKARREIMGDVLQGDISVADANLTPEEWKWVKRTSELNKSVGQELVDNGMLTKKQFESFLPKKAAPKEGVPTEGIVHSIESAGRIAEEERELASNYMHRIYEAHLRDSGKVWSKLVKGDMSPLKEARPINKGITLERENLTKAQREALGQVTDIGVVQEEYLRKALKDISAQQLLHDIEEHMPGIARKNKDIFLNTGEPIKLSELEKNFKLQSDIVKAHPMNISAKERLAALEAAMKEHKPPKGFRLLEEDKGWGPLSGALVHKNLYNDLRSFVPSVQDQSNIAARLWKHTGEKAVNWFKVSKTALNAPSLGRNLFEGLIRLDLSGIPFERATRQWVKAFEVMANPSAHPELIKELQATGLLKGSLTAEELKPAWEALKGDLKEGRGLYNLTHGRFSRVMNKMIEGQANMYQFPDKVTYLAKYIDELEKGSSRAQAALSSAKWGFDYSDVPQWVKHARKSWAPFMTYQYKITPRLIESMSRNPAKLLKYQILPDVILENLSQMHPTFNKDERESVLGMYANNVLTQGHPLFLPARSPKGELRMFDLSHFYPWGNWAEALNEIFSKTKPGEAGWEKHLRGAMKATSFGFPLASLYSSFFNRKEGVPIDMFSGQPIYNPMDSGVHVTYKTLRHIADDMLLPSYLTEKGTLGKLIKVMAGDEDTDASYKDVFLSLLGVTTRTISPEKQKYLVEEAKNTIRKYWGNYEMHHDPDTDKNYMKKYREKEAGIWALDHLGEMQALRHGVSPLESAKYRRDARRVKDIVETGSDDPLTLLINETIDEKHPGHAFWASRESTVPEIKFKFDPKKPVDKMSLEELEYWDEVEREARKRLNASDD